MRAPVLPLSLLLNVLVLGACASTRPATPAPVPAEAPARPTGSTAWIRSELYFGIGDAHEDASAGQARWRAFLDEEVTPRFPAGLTVIEAYGQWLSAGARLPARLRSNVLIILHEPGAARFADIEAIRAAWKQRTGDESVLWVRQPADVSF